MLKFPSFDPPELLGFFPLSFLFSFKLPFIHSFIFWFVMYYFSECFALHIKATIYANIDEYRYR